MVDFAPEYYREAKFLYNTEYLEEMFNRNSIPVNFFKLVSVPHTEYGDEDYAWGDLPSDSVQQDMDAVYHDESDPYIEELQGRQKEKDGEKYFGRDYTSVENIHCVFTTEKAREEALTRFGFEVQNERVEMVIFLNSQIIPQEGDYVQVPLFQEYNEKYRQDDGRVLPPSLFDPDNEMYKHFILYRILHAAPDNSGMYNETILQRVDKPFDQEKITE